MNIKATNMDLTPAIRERVEVAISYAMRHMQTPIESIKTDVEVEKTTSHHNKGEIFRAEINMNVAGRFYRAEDTSSDLYQAIDAARDELVRQRKDNKEKRQTLMRRGARRLKSMLKFGK